MAHFLESFLATYLEFREPLFTITQRELFLFAD